MKEKERDERKEEAEQQKEEVKMREKEAKKREINRDNGPITIPTQCDARQVGHSHLHQFPELC